MSIYGLLLIVVLTAAQTPVIRVGRTVSNSGLQQAEGVPVVQGFDFGVAFINNHTGINFNGTRYNFKVNTWSDGSDPAVAGRLYEDMIIRNESDIYLGPWSTLLTTPVLPILSKYGKPIVFTGASSTAFYTAGYNNSFGLLVQAGKRSLPCMDVFEDQGPKTFAIVTSDDSFQVLSANLIRTQLLARNMTLIYNTTVSRTATSFLDTVAELDIYRPQILILALAINPITPFLEELRQYSWDPEALYVTNSETARQAYDTVGWPADGFFAGNQWSPALPYLDPIFGSAKNFSDVYQAAVGVVPSYLAAAAAMAAFVIKDAVERSPSLAAVDLIAALKQTNIPASFFGPIKFLSSGEVNLQGICEQIQPVTGSVNATQRSLQVVGPETLKTSNAIYPYFPQRPPPPKWLNTKRKLAIGLSLALGIPAAIIVGIGLYFLINYQWVRLDKDIGKADAWS